MTKISFVYFDVGGVAIQDFSDTDKWNVMIDQALGIPLQYRQEFDQLYDQYEDDICLGKIAVDDLQPYIKERFLAQIPQGFSMLKYFLDHFSVNQSIWPIMYELKQKTKVGLLTDQYLDLLDGIFSYKLLPNLKWDAIIDSTKVGFRKPFPQIYEIAEEKTGVPANEILFIDNREKNLVPAQARGWQVYLYDSKNYEKSSNALAAFLQQFTI